MVIAARKAADRVLLNFIGSILLSLALFVAGAAVAPSAGLVAGIIRVVEDGRGFGDELLSAIIAEGTSLVFANEELGVLGPGVVQFLSGVVFALLALGGGEGVDVVDDLLHARVFYIEYRVRVRDELLDFIGFHEVAVEAGDRGFEVVDVLLVVGFGGVEALRDQGGLLGAHFAILVGRVGRGGLRVFEGEVLGEVRNVRGRGVGIVIGLVVFDDLVAFDAGAVFGKRGAVDDDEVDALRAGIATDGKDHLPFFVREDVLGVAFAILHAREDVLGVVLEARERGVVVIDFALPSIELAILLVAAVAIDIGRADRFGSRLVEACFDDIVIGDAVRGDDGDAVGVEVLVPDDVARHIGRVAIVDLEGLGREVSLDFVVGQSNGGAEGDLPDGIEDSAFEGGGFKALFFAVSGAVGRIRGELKVADAAALELGRRLIEERVVSVDAVLEALDEGRFDVHDPEVAIGFGGTGVFGIGLGQGAEGLTDRGAGLAVDAIFGAGAGHHQDNIAKGLGFGFADRGARGIRFACAARFEQDVRDVVGHAGFDVAAIPEAEMLIGGEEGAAIGAFAIADVLEIVAGFEILFEFFEFGGVELLFVELFDVVDVFAGKQGFELGRIGRAIVVGIALGLVLDAFDARRCLLFQFFKVGGSLRIVFPDQDFLDLAEVAVGRGGAVLVIAEEFGSGVGGAGTVGIGEGNCDTLFVAGVVATRQRGDCSQASHNGEEFSFLHGFVPPSLNVARKWYTLMSINTTKT